MQFPDPLARHFYLAPCRPSYRSCWVAAFTGKLGRSSRASSRQQRSHGSCASRPGDPKKTENAEVLRVGRGSRKPGKINWSGLMIITKYLLRVGGCQAGADREPQRKT